MDLLQLRKPLEISDIDFRIQSINKGGYATILAYKDARVDMIRLDEVCGALNWKREHLHDNSNCIVSIWDETKNQWVSKEDTGTDSLTEKEKGRASDSFKRACFNWGIGRELYDYPVIQVKLNSDEFEIEGSKVKATFKLKLKEWKWESEFLNGKLVYLSAKYDNKQRFEFNLISDKNQKKQVKEPTKIDSLPTIPELTHKFYESWKASDKPFDIFEKNKIRLSTKKGNFTFQLSEHQVKDCTIYIQQQIELEHQEQLKKQIANETHER